MCFKREDPPLVAPRAIRVLKLLCEDTYGILRSPVKKYSYFKDAENPKVTLDLSGPYIFDGYHAYLNEQAILNLYRKFGVNNIKELKGKTPYVVGVFEIPKGSTYLVNSRNEVVSENLILRDVL